ncbi:MAG: DUF4177 domain-containing protein [Myxococcota bacterium]|nr:DUF4177 domain-containing protein [Myxococcota bacterium]
MTTTDTKDNPSYKVIELSTVTDDTIEEKLNEMAALGWSLDAIHFAMREGSRRPSMAFLVFVHGKTVSAI